MVHLAANDLEAVLIAVESVGTAHNPVEFSQRAIEQVAALIPSDVVTYNEINPMEGRLVYQAVPEFFPVPTEVQEHLLALADQHPLIRYFTESRDGSAKRVSDFWSQEVFHSSALYELVYQPLGIEYQMSVALPMLNSVVVAIVVNRSEFDFSERDRVVLNTLRPYLTQAWFSARDQLRLQMLLTSTTSALVEGELGLIVLADPPQELTPGALATLYRYWGVPPPPSPWPFRVEEWIASQRARVSGDDPLRLLAPLRAEKGGRRLVLRYLAENGQNPGAILLREEPHRREWRDLELVGLSAREAEVTSCVIGGATNASIGKTMHISSATVKKHLENIYAKLGVRGRGELVAFVNDVLSR